MEKPVSTGPGPALEVSQQPVGYAEALAAMRTRIAAIRAGTAGEHLWFLEHPPLYTSGTSARPADLAEPDRFPTFEAGRGGQWTYHGPGQRIAYIMLDLDQAHGTVPARDTHAYIAGLEQWLIATLRHFGVRGEQRPGRVGVWVADARTGTEAKIAAIGVRITRWVSWHGISLNRAPDLSHFQGIVPCGIRDHGVTSLRAIGIDVSPAELDAVLAAAWRPVFGALRMPGERTGPRRLHPRIFPGEPAPARSGRSGP